MSSIGSATRKARGGQGRLPPNPRQWAVEHHALDVREELGIALDTMLPHERAFALLPGVEVLPHGKVPAAHMYLEHFRGAGATTWSGLAVQMDDGTAYVVYNDAHSITRTRATLMEEFFHLRLGHPRSVVRVLSNGEGGRTYDSATEEEAYACGAAALVPYYGLRRMVDAGMAPAGIARTFVVSHALVYYRLRVTKLFARATHS